MTFSSLPSIYDLWSTVDRDQKFFCSLKSIMAFFTQLFLWLNTLPFHQCHSGTSAALTTFPVLLNSCLFPFFSSLNDKALELFSNYFKTILFYLLHKIFLDCKLWFIYLFHSNHYLSSFVLFPSSLASAIYPWKKKQKGVYVDAVLPVGLRSASKILTAIANGLQWI